MRRCLPSRLLRAVAGAALSLPLVAAGARPAAAQPPGPKPPVERYDDPVGNGIAIGAALGAIGGVVIAGAMYAQCDDLCDAPAELPTYAMFAGFTAGIGAGTGWLIDKLHKGKRPAVVPVGIAFRADRRERAVAVHWRF
jgi:hypothetical protein